MNLIHLYDKGKFRNGNNTTVNLMKEDKSSYHLDKPKNGNIVNTCEFRVQYELKTTYLLSLDAK